MVVGSKKGPHPLGIPVVKGLRHGPGNAEPVIGACASPDLIQDHQAFRRRVPDDVRGFVHFDHKGALPLCQVVRSADPGENPVHKADGRPRCRHKAAHLGHQHREGDLPQNGRFAGHVRPCDDQDLLLPIVKLDVVGDKRLLLHGLLDHGMPAVGDLNHGALAHLGAGIAVEFRCFRQPGKRVHLSHKTSRLFDSPVLQSDLLADLLENLAFQGHSLFFRPEDKVFVLLEPLRDVAFAVGKGLFSDVVRGYQVQVGSGHLDVIAENTVVSDLEAGYSRFLLLRGRQLGDPRLPVPGGRDEAVEIRIVPLPDHAAFFGRDRRFIANRRIDHTGNVFERIEAAGDLGKAFTGRPRQEIFYPRQALYRVFERHEIPCVGPAERDAAVESFHVVDPAQRLLDALSKQAIVPKAPHSGQAAANLPEIQQGIADPPSQLPASHGRHRPVQDVKQRSF